MALVSQSISSFKGGVSQQPDVVRYPDQLKEQINAFSSEVEGLQKRPPSIHIGRLGDSLGDSKVRYHIINRDENEQYVLEMKSGGLRVWDLQGNSKTVTVNEDAEAYLVCEDPLDDFRAITIADYTFILNRKFTTKMATDLTPDNNEGYVLFDIRGGNYGKTFEIWIDDDFKAGLRIPAGTSTWHVRYTSTSKIAECLYYALKGKKGGENPDEYWGGVTWAQGAGQLSGSGDEAQARVVTSSKGWDNIGITDNFDVKIFGDSTIGIRKKDGSDFKYVGKDGSGGTLMYTAKTQVTAENKLPNAAPDGFVLRIRGYSNSDTSDDYYVEWVDSDKTWKEAPAIGIEYKFDTTTMPHALVRQSDGTFKFQQLEWADRLVGDDDSNPVPSFIDRTINDIFFYRNRLGFISDENIILSASSDFFNFWFETATGVLDTDCIDVAVSSNKVSILTHAIPFSRELMLFSREGQFVLGSDGTMTPKTVKVDQVTSFEYNPEVQPLNIGNNIYFVNNRVDYCSLMRFYTIQDVADLRDAEDVSSHIPRYIPVGISRISGNSTENTITMISETNPNTIWIYKFIMANGVNLQQSWSKWTMGTPDTRILLAEFVNANIYFVLSTPSGLYLERAELTGNTIDFADEPVRLFMDRKKEYVIPSDSKYSDFNNYTEVSFSDVYGAVPTLGTTYFLVTPEGYVYKVPDWDEETGKFRVTGDLRNQKVFVGRQFEFRVDLSQIVIKQSNAAGSVVSEDEGRLMLRYFWFNYSDSGVFHTRVTNSLKHREYNYTCTSKLLGRSDTQLGVNKVFSNIFKFPIHEVNTEVDISVISDNVQPLNIISGGWEGLYTRRTQKV